MCDLFFRELWRKIYRGNDIDYIEIKTEGNLTVESERRKYDYRYVQHSALKYKAYKHL